MMPVLRRTWAPCGITPTFSVRTRSHEKVSGIGALVVSPRRRQITLALALYPRLNIRGPQVLRFLRHLARHVRGPVVLVWDRWQPPQARPRPRVARPASALGDRLVPALRARPQPGGVALELSQIWPARELRAGHRRRHSHSCVPRATAPRPTSAAAEELLSALGLVFSCLI